MSCVQYIYVVAHKLIAMEKLHPGSLKEFLDRFRDLGFESANMIFQANNYVLGCLSTYLFGFVKSLKLSIPDLTWTFQVSILAPVTRLTWEYQIANLERLRKSHLHLTCVEIAPYLSCSSVAAFYFVNSVALNWARVWNWIKEYTHTWLTPLHFWTFMYPIT